MNKKISKKIKFLLFIVIVLLLSWFLYVSPMITFHNHEKNLENAARRYFELNSSLLPTGERIKTISLNTLYHGSYIKGDIFIPYTHKTCSVDNSWVKVRQENGEYKYYTYLQCGILKSKVDHEGPVLTLNGKKEITIGVNEEYKDPGVKSVIDKIDGTINKDKVIINGEVDTSKVGTYEISYSAYDQLNNKSTQKRIVTVVKKLSSTVKDLLKEEVVFKDFPENNYLRLSGMLFRIYGIDSNNNIIIVSDEDIANVNYSKIDEWLDYYYAHLNKKAQDMIVKAKYCNMMMTEETIHTTECSSYTDLKKVYIPSIPDINKTIVYSDSYMTPFTMSWTANSIDSTNAYLTRNVFFEENSDKIYLSYPIKDNYGVRPMMTIKGSSLLVGGDGTSANPYVFDDLKKAKGGSLINERYTGEFISINGFLYRIIDTLNDGTTKVISYNTVGTSNDNITCVADPNSDKISYNPKNSNSVAYFIQNKISKYLDTSYFESHDIDVPIYKDDIIYKEEIETQKYRVLLSAPNMYEMFSAQPQLNSDCLSYWLINTSKADRTTGAISLIGVPLNQTIPLYLNSYVRVVGFLKKGTVISSGLGTFESPYIVK